MPSSFAHAIFAASLTPLRPYNGKLLSSLLLAMSCAIIPDLDVIGFQMGIQYGDIFGHRGFTHSIVFALMLGLIVSYCFFKDYRDNSSDYISISWFYFLCTMSHGILDAMTDGGLGVGFFIPFSDERFFFPLRPIPVSPLNIQSFFTSHGWFILKQEMLFVGILSLIAGAIGYYWRKYIFMKN